MEATTDVWEIEPASATRVGHPAPSPVELPQRLIDLYTYRGDLVLDPFMGAGTTAVAAKRTGRYYVGFDTDAGDVALAEQRVAEERERLDRRTGAERFEVSIAPACSGIPTTLQRHPHPNPPDPIWWSMVSNPPKPTRTSRLVPCAKVAKPKNLRAAHYLGRASKMSLCHHASVAEWRSTSAPLTSRVGHGFSSSRVPSPLRGVPGLRRSDTLWKVLGKAAALHASFEDESPHGTDSRMRLVLLTTDRPTPNSAGHRALQALMGESKPIHDVIGFLEEEGLRRLAELASGETLSG